MESILVAFDGSEPGRRALERAAQLARETGAPLTVLTVARIDPGCITVDAEEESRVARHQHEAAMFLVAAGLSPALVRRAGDPGHEIARFADEGGFAVVIVGSRPLDEIERLLKGSVSRQVATESRTRVIVVD